MMTLATLIHRPLAALCIAVALGHGLATAQGTAAGVGAATGGAAPGGVFVQTRATTLPPARNPRYEAAAHAIVTDDWTYRLPVSLPEAKEIFAVISKQDFLAADVTPRGEAFFFGLPRDSKVAARMLVTDLLLGDIAKGIGYFAPLYRTALDYKPRQHNVISAQQFAVIFVFTSDTWRIDGIALVSVPRKLEVLSVPTIRQPDGRRRFDFDAMKRNIEDSAIAENARHIVANEDYYRRERAVRDVQAYSDVAQLARELRQQSVAIGSLLGN